MTTKFSIEDVPSRKEKKTLLDAIQKLIPEPIPGEPGKSLMLGMKRIGGDASDTLSDAAYIIGFRVVYS